MALLSGFTQPVDQSQQVFRLVLKALSEPGHLAALPASLRWESLDPATVAVLLTLADGETPVYIAPALRNDSVATTLRFHTGAPLADTPDNAGFALFDRQLVETELQALPCGDDISPETGVTVLVQIDSLSDGEPLRLRGPGIRQWRDISPSLPPAVREYLLRRPQRFPMGLDFILLCENRLMAIPRTTQAEVC